MASSPTSPVECTLRPVITYLLSLTETLDPEDQYLSRQAFEGSKSRTTPQQNLLAECLSTQSFEVQRGPKAQLKPTSTSGHAMSGPNTGKSLDNLINLGGALLIECGGQKSTSSFIACTGARLRVSLSSREILCQTNSRQHQSSLNELLVTRASAEGESHSPVHCRPVFVAITLSARARQAQSVPTLSVRAQRPNQSTVYLPWQTDSENTLSY